jgi:Leucine-rich repeat (LRR) protein
MLVLRIVTLKMRILIMNNNQLTSLPKEMGELTNLLYLEIGNNKLKVYQKKLSVDKHKSYILKKGIK